MVNGNPGKGDAYRKVDVKKYDTNYEALFSPPMCESCTENLRQDSVGSSVFYCTNPKCTFYKVKIDYSKGLW
jgi:hypothetical protein